MQHISELLKENVEQKELKVFIEEKTEEVYLVNYIMNYSTGHKENKTDICKSKNLAEITIETLLQLGHTYLSCVKSISTKKIAKIEE